MNIVILARTNDWITCRQQLGPGLFGRVWEERRICGALALITPDNPVPTVCPMGHPLPTNGAHLDHHQTR